jgi:D-alanine-D-alanine ligase
VAGPDGLSEALRTAARFGRQVVVEEQVTGREVDIAALRTPDGTVRLSPPLEIVVGADTFFDTTRKYDGTAEFLVPAALEADDLATIGRHTIALATRLGCAGVARFDYFVTADGPVLNEVNTVPGFTEHSQVPRMFAADGLSYRDLLTELVDGVRGGAVRQS